MTDIIFEKGEAAFAYVLLMAHFSEIPLLRDKISQSWNEQKTTALVCSIAQALQISMAFNS